LTLLAPGHFPAMSAASASVGYVEPHRGLHHERAATMPNLLDGRTPAIGYIVALPLYLTRLQIPTSSSSHISINIPCPDDHAAEVPHLVGKYCVKHAGQVQPSHPSSLLPRVYGLTSTVGAVSLARTLLSFGTTHKRFRRYAPGSGSSLPTLE